MAKKSKVVESMVEDLLIKEGWTPPADAPEAVVSTVAQEPISPPLATVVAPTTPKAVLPPLESIVEAIPVVTKVRKEIIGAGGIFLGYRD